MSENRKIIHVDMDAFFASIEQRDNPALRGKPVIVGGSPQSRGVVAAASYEARQFKIRSAMSCFEAARLCPHAIFVRPRFSRYQEVSGKLHRILREVSDCMEPLGLDEAYLDVTENKLGEKSATKLGRYLKARIKGQLQLTASAGVAPNKFLAKLASEMKKPDGLFVIGPDDIEATVRCLDVEKLWGVGPATAAKLRGRGWNTTEDLRRQSIAELCSVVGSQGRFLFGLAHGLDPRPVSGSREMKSRGAETTFAQDTLDTEALKATLLTLTQRVSDGLQKKGVKANSLTLKIRYSDFSTITRSTTLSTATSECSVFYELAQQLLHHSTQAGKRPVRLIGISVAGFKETAPSLQLIFPDL
jgi:DNA polymerase IV